ncbi:ATPase [Candidatus Methylacidiphilum fumarolicum]|uniref:HAD-IC family P-type ATPase n=1 Tax=Candidatus Methylacidiphilum fumarolicum TaxID=591154 RepID=UPI000312D982|nr:HAD-IC family P-type ATPase [Candidatus Methylacidiphilum fumarolicum]MBW6415677.1 HAD-IC family P-type ATPase [Candidatus Methylacidiphilum fumarolicum]TFE67564.1 ATPase [Candidatus Methylacidiphilum fumarolicum]TFE71623.1 ATPase [Candidatus Methylacidiphilum fumarolicum]TFE73594.1 ATPase [Candidatus Methylacidiphilum fumarolicum]TFE75350.1 ATPase [Candidatus Methylacidiphilum fumarolicum]
MPYDSNKLYLGLSWAEAKKRLLAEGPNTPPEKKESSLLLFLSKFWAPVPWMLEITILLEILLHRIHDGIAIAGFLVCSSMLSFLQEHRSKRALFSLLNKLSPDVRVLRDGVWTTIPAKELVCGDLVLLRSGDIVPADLQLIDGEIEVNESAITGESLPRTAQPEERLLSGSFVESGQARGIVIATGAKTHFGKTTRLIEIASPPSEAQKVIFNIVKALVYVDSLLIALIFLYGMIKMAPLSFLLPYALVILIASVPVTLPSVFTLATALGSKELAEKGVLCTKLSALEDASTMDILLVDKTGTLTCNELKLHILKPFAPCTEQNLLLFAALCSDPLGENPIDKAILEKVDELHLSTKELGLDFQHYIPADPKTKMAKAIYKDKEGRQFIVLKGSVSTVLKTIGIDSTEVLDQAKTLETDGSRILAVAYGSPAANTLLGLIGFSDPLRNDAKELIAKIKWLGIKVVMVTGDQEFTAKSIGKQVGIGEHSITLSDSSAIDPQQIENYDIIAGVFPEDKYRIVQAFQKKNHVTGMTGDGVNDAPALRQAQVGIAVSNAVDVAKSAASLILTNPGLMDIIPAIMLSRAIFERILTYILNKIIKTVEVAFFMTLGLIVGNTFVLNPFLGVLLVLYNDVLTLSLVTDRVKPANRIRKWPIQSIVIAGTTIGIMLLFFSFGLFLVAKYALKLDPPHLQSISFILLVLEGQATLYLVRERHHLWHSLPSPWMIVTSVMVLLGLTFQATKGIGMENIGFSSLMAIVIAILLYFFILDSFKVWLFRRLHL